MLLGTATTILVPKNRGLAAQAQAALASRGFSSAASFTFVRGEDVAQFANAAVREGSAVFALTGDDLLDNWLASGNALDDRIERQRLPWRDSSAMYGKPALCLIAAPEARLDRPQLRVAVCQRYAALAEKTLKNLEAGGSRVHRIYCQGATESVIAAGIADAAIDIVMTGGSIAECGLTVRAVLYTSDLAVLVSR